MMIFDEKQFGKFLYENQTDPKLPARFYSIWELTILAKYLRQELNKTETEIRTNIVRFCNLNYPGFDETIDYDRINKVMIDMTKTDLRATVAVPITKTEWEYISKLSSETYQKILFCILAVAKFNRLSPILYTEENDKDINYEDTRLRCNLHEQELYKMMHIRMPDFKTESSNLYKEVGKKGLNLIEIPPSKKIKRILNFGELDPKEEDILLWIENFDKLNEYFYKIKNPDDGVAKKLY